MRSVSTGRGGIPAAWRAADARPKELLTAGYWVDVVTEAERGLFDFVTIEDKVSLQTSLFSTPDERTDQVRGRLDAVQIAARVAPLTTHIGLVPTATVTHTEPFHVSKALATLDFVSNGRAGWRMQNSFFAHEAALFGRRTMARSGRTQLTRRSSRPESITSTRRPTSLRSFAGCGDSWEDDAEIRDASTGRFIDRDKLHYIDFEGRWFSVRGPSITPRPPQGQPVVTALGHARIPWRFGGRSTDVAYITPKSTDEAAETVAVIREAQAEYGRTAETVHIFGIWSCSSTRTRRWPRVAKPISTSWTEHRCSAMRRYSPAIRPPWPTCCSTGAAAGLSGFRLRPGVIPHDLRNLVDLLVPELQRRGVFRTEYEANTLRGLLGIAPAGQPLRAVRSWRPEGLTRSAQVSFVSLVIRPNARDLSVAQLRRPGRLGQQCPSQRDQIELVPIE